MIYVSKKYAIFKNNRCMGIRKTKKGADNLFYKILINSNIENNLISMYLNGYLIYQI